jgi:Family of unknown function (DUF5906)
MLPPPSTVNINPQPVVPNALSPVVPPPPVVEAHLSPALRYLERFPQFIVYLLTPSIERPGKLDKLPINLATRAKLEWTTPSNWMTYQAALAAANSAGPHYGVGFVITPETKLFCLDVDGALQKGVSCTGCFSEDTRQMLTAAGLPEGLNVPNAECGTCKGNGVDRKWHPLAGNLRAALPRAGFEFSVSYEGFHNWGRYEGPEPAHAKVKVVEGIKIELFTSGKWFALGDQSRAEGDAGADCTVELYQVIAEYFKPDAADTKKDWNEGHELGWELPADDELIRIVLSFGGANAAFGDGVSFADLWTRNVAKLSKRFQSETAEFGESEADLALAGKLAWLTGNDCPRIERLMRQSALARPKWDSHATYLSKFTIPRGLVKDGEFWDPKYPERQAEAAMAAAGVTPGAGGPLPREVSTNTFLTHEQQKAHFEGCVYIESTNRALCPDGSILRQEAFSVRYAGFNFRLDTDNQKVTDDAWKAWTKSRAQGCVSAYGTCFKPKLPFGEIVTRSGHSFVNTYRQLDIERKAGDVSPFLGLLAQVLPDKRDAIIFLSYMAACVQHQGVKFQWAPLLQGVEGNGKTLFSRCVQQAVGERYTHWAKASELGKNFNAWMTGKVLYAVEDIYVPDSKNSIMEDLKPMITGKQIEIELKGVDKITADICGNFMFNSNHQDAIRKTKNDRRFCMLFTAQQSIEDLERDGMGPHSPYLPNLYKWLDAGGYAIVNEFLYTYAIPAEFNPAGDCQRAPATSSTHKAIEASLGGVEQDIQEAIDEGRPGFCGGWVSSHFVALLPRAERLTSKKRHQILEGMGYVTHPALESYGSRVCNQVLPDRSRSKLYIRRTDTALLQIASPALVAKSYETANQHALANSAFAGGNYRNY